MQQASARIVSPYALALGATMSSQTLLHLCGAALLLPLACSGKSGHANPGDGAATSVTSSGSGTGGQASGVTSTGAGATGSGGQAVTTSSTAAGAGGSSGGAIGTSSTGAASSGGGMAGSPDEGLFVPEGLRIEKLAGGGDDINLTRLTFVEGPAGPELFAVVENDGQDSGCDPNISIEFFDQNERSLATWIGGLYTPHLYQRSDDPSTLISCLDPGDTALAGSTELPDGIVVDDVALIVYRFSYFAADILPFDLIPIDSLTVSQLAVASGSSGSSFTGSFDNGLDVPVSDPIITVFPVDEVGRPLGIAESRGTVEVAAGDSWMFETSPVRDAGVDRLVYAGASPVIQ